MCSYASVVSVYNFLDRATFLYHVVEVSFKCFFDTESVNLP